MIWTKTAQSRIIHWVKSFQLAVLRAALLGLIFVTAFAAQASSYRENQMLLFDFTNKDELRDWRVVNDGVMGGLSQGEIVLTDSNTAVFRGVLSLENNGGFSSARTLPRSFNLDSYTGLILRVRGDGKQYQLRLRQDDGFDGVAYRYRFQTIADEWLTIEVPFNACVPVFRGRELQDVEPLSPAQIQQLGFLIADGQAGPFRLEVDWISAHGL